MEEFEDRLSYKIRGAVYEVHNYLGLGLFEECYHQALVHELKLRGLNVVSKPQLPVKYKGVEIKNAYEPDINVIISKYRDASRFFIFLIFKIYMLICHDALRWGVARAE